jgi:hypothetical protein
VLNTCIVEKEALAIAPILLRPIVEKEGVVVNAGGYAAPPIELTVREDIDAPLDPPTEKRPRPILVSSAARLILFPPTAVISIRLLLRLI